jgi:RloB-like protein
MRPRRPIIPQRTPIFVGCEGESEQAYGQILNDLLREAKRPVHLEVVNLNPGAGDPFARLRKAEQEIIRRRQRRSEFRLQVVLMDSDQVDTDSKRWQQAERCAQDLGIRIIWQEPCHEAMLLRHLDGFACNRPLTSGTAQAILKAAWPDYRKPMTKIQLAQRIDLSAVQRAAT